MDKLTLYQGALRICKDRKLASLTEDRAPRHLLDDAWNEGAVLACLEAGQWQFATRTLRMDYDGDVDPDFGYRRAFLKPDDFVRMVAISEDEFFTEPMTSFADEGAYIYAEPDQIYVKHVSDDEDYGGDMSLWPMYFSEYVMHYLAFKINPRLTTSGTATDEIERRMEKALSNAQNKDGTGRPTRFPSRGSWVKARTYGGSPSDYRRR